MRFKNNWIKLKGNIKEYNKFDKAINKIKLEKKLYNRKDKQNENSRRN